MTTNRPGNRILEYARGLVARFFLRFGVRAGNPRSRFEIRLKTKIERSRVVWEQVVWRFGVRAGEPRA